MRANVDSQTGRRPSAFVAATALLVLLAAGQMVVATPPAAAGDVCKSSAAAKDLVSCDNCYALKALLSDTENIRIDVYDLEHGAIVQITSTDPESVQTLRAAVDHIWHLKEEDDAGHCSGCESRHTRLAQAVRDRAVTDTGVILVLTSDDAKLAKWLRSDARKHQTLLASAN